MTNKRKIDKALAYIRHEHNAGKSDLQIRHQLINEGMEAETADKLISIFNNGGNAGSVYNGKQKGGIYADPVKRAKGQRNIAIGSVVLIIGVFVTVVTATRAVNEGGVYIIATGPIAGGIALLIGGIIQVVSSR